MSPSDTISKHATVLSFAIAILAVAGCEESFDDDGAGGDAASGSTLSGEPTAGPDASSATGFGGSFDEEGTTVDVTVPESGRAYVDLGAPAVTDESGPWDLAFEGLDVFTHGGITAEGTGAAFGPYVAAQFISDDRPEVPFLIEDHAGGAFLDWYDYDGTTHALYSRFHVVGVRNGEARWKVQVLGYYGEIDGAPVSAVYGLRVASVDGDVGETLVIEDIDGTAGGPTADADQPSGCVDLDTGATIALTVVESQANQDWDLCFRRDVITVNGELGGPGDVEAVNLDEAAIATETLEEVQERTASSEEGRFDDVDAASLDDPGLAWRGDRIISAFSDKWLQVGASPVAPDFLTWLVVGDDGREFLVAFESFTGATATNPGTIRIRLKPLSD